MKFEADYTLLWFPKEDENLKGEVSLYGFEKKDWISLFNDDYEISLNDSIEIVPDNCNLILCYLPRNFEFKFEEFDYFLEVFESAEEGAYHIRNELVLPFQAALQEIEDLKKEIAKLKQQLTSAGASKPKRKIAV